ncbi:hypothetical protein [Halpernia frigidisoli]|nr:hypothetical protein [Halpernia frigidisoli]
MQQIPSFENIEQLEGNWYLIKKTTQQNDVVNSLEIQCLGKLYWEISKINGNYNLKKHFASGKNCETHVIKTDGLNYANGRLNYREGDIVKSELLEKLNEKAFKITEKSFANGETILIETFYEKR